MGRKKKKRGERNPTGYSFVLPFSFELTQTLAAKAKPNLPLESEKIDLQLLPKIYSLKHQDGMDGRKMDNLIQKSREKEGKTYRQYHFTSSPSILASTYLLS